MRISPARATFHKAPQLGRSIWRRNEAEDLGSERLDSGPGPGNDAVRRKHLVRRGNARGRHQADPRRRHGDPEPGVGLPAPRGADPHPAHPPAPGPRPGADVLLPGVQPRVRDHGLGTGVGLRRAVRPDRKVHLGPSGPDRAARPSLLVPRGRADGLADRLGADPCPARSTTGARRSAYRIEDGNTSLAYIPDHEPGLGTPLDELEDEWLSGYELAKDASLLIHDCQYTDREYREHHGWGHCPVSDALDFGRRTGAKRMLLFHHDPMHSDDFLDGMRDDITRLWEERGGNPDRRRAGGRAQRARSHRAGSAAGRTRLA